MQLVDLHLHDWKQGEDVGVALGGVVCGVVQEPLRVGTIQRLEIRVAAGEVRGNWAEAVGPMTFSLELDIAVVSNVGDVDETLRVQKTTVAEVEVATKPMNHAFAPLVFSLLASAAVLVARE